jgi:putative ABC transport system substrate-binding protein
MRRRDFITLVGGAAVAWPLAARAQQADKVQRIGVVMDDVDGDPEAQVYVMAFRQKLQELGWTDGRNLRIDYRWAAGDSTQRQSYAQELVGSAPAVILTVGTPLVAALHRATRTIPIVFISANNPIGFGFVASLARPGGNITGFIEFEPSMGGKWLETLKEIAPRISQVALIFNPDTHTGQYFASIEAAASSLSVTATRTPFHSAAEIESAINAFAIAPNVGLLVLPDVSTALHRDLIIALAAKYHLPAIFPFRRFVTNGGLVWYGTDLVEQFRQAASYVDRILRGAKPDELPVQAAVKFDLVINLKTAKALGLTIPEKLLVRADEVIE